MNGFSLSVRKRGTQGSELGITFFALLDSGGPEWEFISSDGRYLSECDRLEQIADVASLAIFGPSGFMSDTCFLAKVLKDALNFSLNSEKSGTTFYLFKLGLF